MPLALHRSHRLACPRITSHRIAASGIASPCLQRLACIASLSLASPRSPCLDRHRLGFDRLPRLALLASPPCSPRLARLASPESLALPRLARLASLASPLARSPRLRARLPRSPCLLPRLGQPLATSASRCLQRCLQNLGVTAHATRTTAELGFRVAWLAPV